MPFSGGELLNSELESSESRGSLKLALLYDCFGAGKTDEDTECQLVHTLAHAIVVIVSICCFSNSGAAYIFPFFSNGPANRSRAGPSYDEPTTNLKVMVGARQATGTTVGAAGSAEAEGAATPVLDSDDGDPTVEAGMVAKLLSESNRVKGTVGSRVAS